MAGRDGLVRYIFAINAIYKLKLEVTNGCLKYHSIATICARGKTDNEYLFELYDNVRVKVDE